VPEATAVLSLQATSLKEESRDDQAERPISPDGREAYFAPARNDGYRAGLTQNHRDAKTRHDPYDAKIGASVAKPFLRHSHALRR
jgi:hypothetical protein